MIFLLLSIVFSTVTVIMFKVFERNGVDTFEAIVVNYLTCSIIGNLLAPQNILVQKVWLNPWFLQAAILGLLFITIFNFIAQTAQKLGVSVSMVAAKLSVAVPVLVAVWLYDEPVNALKIAGIVLSMVAVYFISKKDEVQAQAHGKLWYLPCIVFAGSGAIDTLLHFVEHIYIPPSDADSIVCTIFSIAFVLGSTVLVFNAVTKKKMPAMKNVGWGVLLGIPNYFSMYFLVKTLESFEGSYSFPINNIGIVAASTVVAVVAFKERLSKFNRIGLGLAIISILLISFA